MFKHSRIHMLLDEINSLQVKFNVPWKMKRSRKFMKVLDQLMLEVEAYTTDIEFKTGLMGAMLRDRKIPIVLSNEWSNVASIYTRIVMSSVFSFEPYRALVDEFMNLKTDEEAMIFRLTQL